MTKKIPNEIVQLSKVHVSDKAISNSNISQLIRSVQEGTKNIDEYKKKKQKFEEQSWIKKTWNRGELNDMVKDASEKQLELSKANSQLLVLNTLISKAILSQQTEIESQQQEIINQNMKIESIMGELKSLDEKMNKSYSGLREDVSELITSTDVILNNADKINDFSKTLVTILETNEKLEAKEEIFNDIFEMIKNNQENNIKIIEKKDKNNKLIFSIMGFVIIVLSILMIDFKYHLF